MGRLNKLLESAQAQTQQHIEKEADDILSRMDDKPDNIDSETWDVIQDNGRLATKRLHEILISPKFRRLRAGDQAKLIALAQNRAYGMPKTQKESEGKGAIRGDVTASELNKLRDRTMLPEYKLSGIMDEDE